MREPILSLPAKQSGSPIPAQPKRRQTARLGRGGRKKDQFLAHIVHDFKNPLTAILVNADFLINMPHLRAADRETLADIEKAAQTLQRMVMDMLDVCSGEGGDLKPRLVDVQVGRLVAEVVHAMRPYAAARKQSLRVELPDTDPSIRADRDLLRRVVENLIDNGLKYSPEGGTVTITIASAGPALMRLRVADQGEGVPRAERARVFKMYTRLDRDADRESRTSRGLGLAFCKLAVAAHGGRIFVEDNPPHGSCFCVELPTT